MGDCLVSSRWIAFYSSANNKMDLLHNKKEIVMAQYISKSALVAEIEKLESRFQNWSDEDYADGYHYSLKLLKRSLNSLEVKEVDLEKELNIWRHNHFHGRRDKEANGEYFERISQLDLAKHFFELGLKLKKGE